MTTDYSKYWYLETFIMNDVRDNLMKNGYLTTFEFFCIIIWKANRSKSKIAARLRTKNPDLEQAVRELTAKIYQANESKIKLKILIEEFGLRLPIASAILSLLYPDSFTIYDVRICDTLTDYKGLTNRKPFDKLWSDYTNFIESVRDSGPTTASLREIDKMLWGKSFFDQLNKDIKDNFPVRTKK